MVDNAPDDQKAQECAAHWGARYVVEPVVGASRARNRGAWESEAEVVAYLDDDSVPEPGWLLGVAGEFEDPRVMAVAGRVLPLAVETDAERLRDLTRNEGVDNRREFDRSVPEWFEMANFGGIGIGPNMAFRRSAFDTWSGFCELLGPGTPMLMAEEPYAFFSLIDQGHRVVYTPDSVVRHPYPQNMADLRARRRREMAASTGYATFLLLEEPRYRLRTLKYLLEAVRRSPRKWRNVAQSHPRVVSAWSTIGALMAGPFRYAYSRFKAGRVTARTVGAGKPTF